MNQVTRRALVRIGAAAAAAGVTALAACGQAGQPGASGAGNSPAKVSGAPLFWQWGPGYVDGFQALIAEFNDKKTGVTVTQEASATTDYWNKLTAALAGNTGPDVFLMNGVNALAWSSRKQVRDLTELNKRDGGASKDFGTVVKSFTEFYQTGGKLLGWPWDFSAALTAYNADHMKEEGLKTPGELGDAWDWNAVSEYARKLNKPGQRWGFRAHRSIEIGWLNYVVANGGAFLSADRKRCVIASAEAMEATQFLVDLIHKQRIAPNEAELAAVGGQVDGFVGGKISIGTYGDWHLTDFAKKSQGANWDVTFIAKSPKTKKTGNMTNFRGIVMNPATKQVDAGWEFMKHMLTKPVQDRIPKLFSESPARQDSAEEVYASAEKAGPPAGRARLKESIRATQPLPTHNTVPWTDTTAIFDPILLDMFENKVTVRDGLTKMQDELNALFQRAGG